MRLCNLQSGWQSAQVSHETTVFMSVYTVYIYLYVCVAKFSLCLLFKPLYVCKFFKINGKEKNHSPRASLSEADLEICVLE